MGCFVDGRRNDSRLQKITIYLEGGLMSDGVTGSVRPRSRFVAIATDLHFWIPLSVLMGGLLLLDKLR
jgi:hypothetical protein